MVPNHVANHVANHVGTTFARLTNHVQTTFNHVQTLKNMRGHFTNHCQGTTKSGRDCRWALPDGLDYCPHHDPETNDSVIASRAGRASAEARRRPEPAQLMDALLSLNDRASIQAVIDSTIRLTLSGHLSAERANIIMRGCSIAARNFDPTVETLAGPKPPTHDYEPYLTKVESILLTIDRLLANPPEDLSDA